MPYLLNRQHVPERLIQEEFGRIGRDPRWNAIADLQEQARQIYSAAEERAINKSSSSRRH